MHRFHPFTRAPDPRASRRAFLGDGLGAVAGAAARAQLPFRQEHF